MDRCQFARPLPSDQKASLNEKRALAENSLGEWGLMAKYFIGIAALLFLVVVGFLLSIPLLVRDVLPVVGPGTTTSLSTRGSNEVQSARISVDRTGRYVLDLTVSSQESDPPNVRFVMEAHGMTATPDSARSLGEHRFQYTGMFGMDGRWKMQIGGLNQSDYAEFVLSIV